MSRSEYYLRRAEECERQDAIAKLKSSREDFLSAAVLWRKLAARAVQREATEQHQTQRSWFFSLIGGFHSVSLTEAGRRRLKLPVVTENLIRAG
jgi:hypothetical protein